jgi:hypothetical protein
MKEKSVQAYDFIVGDGFRIAYTDGVVVYFDQQYQGISTRDWRTHEATPFPFSNGNNDEVTWYKYTVKFDYRTCRIYRRTVSGSDVLKNANFQWIDNMTEQISATNSASFTTNAVNFDGLIVSNVVVTPFIHSRKSPYVWEGVVGNTSDKHYGDSMHAPWWPVKKLILGGTNFFYTAEYTTEGSPQLSMFSPTNPQVVFTNFGILGSAVNPGIGQMFTNLVIQTNALFAAGNTATKYFKVANTNADTIQTYEYDDDGALQLKDHGLTQPTAAEQVLKCTAQSTGTLPGLLSSSVTYFIRVSNVNTLTLHTTASGALNNTARVDLRNFGSGTHWLNATGLVYAYSLTDFSLIGSQNSYFPAEFDPTSLNAIIAPSNRLAVATNPVDGKIAVYDKSTEQVKVFNGTNLVLTIGTNGGYANGPSVPFPVTGDTNFAKRVKLGGYYLDKVPGFGANMFAIPRATVCYQADGKLWVSDSATARMLLFNSDGSLETYIESVPHSYRTSVDPSNVSRVFANFLEFRVDYSQPIKTGWVLENYWGNDIITTNGVRTNYFHFDKAGFFGVRTITVGGSNRTFALAPREFNTNKFPSQVQNLTLKLVELTDVGMKETLSDFLPNNYELNDVGGVDLIEGTTDRHFTRRTLLFTNGHAYLSAAQDIGSSFTNAAYPWGEGAFRISGTNFIMYDTSKDHTPGFHLGAVSTNGATTRAWAWTNMPAGIMNGNGIFGTDSNGGETFVVSGSDIFVLYGGEFWRQDGQANQIFHYKTNGKFVGQFGQPLALKGYTRLPPGSANNLFTIDAVRVGNSLYIYTNDENSRGIHRWRVNL